MMRALQHALFKHHDFHMQVMTSTSPVSFRYWLFIRTCTRALLRIWLDVHKIDG